MILFLHNRYRTTGGEERVVADLQWLVREQLGEDAELLTRDSVLLGRFAAARGLLAGGLDPEEVGRAVRRTRARVVHAHNLHPTLGWRALRAARDAGARVVLHLHNYRLVCAVGTCFNSRGEDCARCQGIDTTPGVRLNCRGTGGAEAGVYGAGLALQQRRLTAHADAIVVPSQTAAERLRELRAPVDPRRLHVVPHVVRSFATGSAATAGTYALVASRLAPEKGVETAIDACARAGLALRIAGDGPSGEMLKARAAAAARAITFLGRLDDAGLAEQRAGAALAIVASRAAETFGLAAAEAMAAGLPVAATRAGALQDLLDPSALCAPGDVDGLARTARELFGDEAAGVRNLETVRARCSPARVAAALREIYEG